MRKKVGFFVFDPKLYIKKKKKKNLYKNKGSK